MDKIKYELPVVTDAVTTNPCKVINSEYIESAPDPFVIKFNGMFYMYATGGEGVKISSSTDLENWTFVGYECPLEGQHDFWAPSVIYKNGSFYMYYSCMGNDLYQFMCVAVADSPTGPFVFKKQLFDYFSIDSHVIRADDGEYYLFYAVDCYNGTKLVNPGTAILVDKLTDMFTLEGKPRAILEPTMDQEIYEKFRFSDNAHWHTLEGAFYIKHHDKEFLMYSGNCYMNYDYFVGYAMPSDITKAAPFIDKDWKKYPDDYTYFPIMKKNDVIEGTGHHSVVKTLDNAENRIVYHARPIEQVANIRPNERVAYTDRLFIDGNTMWSAIPSSAPQDAPALPYLMDRFDNGLDNWTVIDGSWRTENGALVNDDERDNHCIISSEKFENYIFEVYTKANNYHIGPAYGMFLSYLDSKNNLYIRFCTRHSEAKVVHMQNGIRRVVHTFKLDSDYNHQVLHAVRIHKMLDNYTVYIDDYKTTEFVCRTEAGCIGFHNGYGKISFSTVAVTKLTDSFGVSVAELFDADDSNGFYFEDGDGLSYYTVHYDSFGKLTYNRQISNVCELSAAVMPKTSAEDFEIIIELSDNVTIKIACDNFNMKDTHYINMKRCKDKMYVIIDRYCVYDGICEGKTKFTVASNNCAALKEFIIKEW